MPLPVKPLCKNPWYVLDKRLVESQSQSARRGKERNPCSCRESNPGCPDLNIYILSDGQAAVKVLDSST